MLVLAVEQSSSRGSVALLDDLHTLTQRIWEENRLRSRRLFPAMEEIFQETGRKLADINLLAAGIGPGIFSGLRISISAISGMAQPRQTPVAGINSAEALASELSAETGIKQVAVFGDARRGFLWFGMYEAGMTTPAAIRIIKPEDLWTLPLSEALVVSPDWDRISSLLSPLKTKATRVIEAPLYPSAAHTGRLALQKFKSGFPDLPLSPIYLHPAV
jgi:tRNA threonylcarbamoyladenosine biosynthesis protein TsaB